MDAPVGRLQVGERHIFFAPPESYVKATQRIWHTPEHPTAIGPPVIE